MTRFMGTETEYGIATPSRPQLSPIITSTHAVVSYAALRTGARSRWDYQDEEPLADARGFNLRRYHTVPVVEADTIGVANVMTASGARFYVDHAHPEYSSPEVSNAFDAMVYDAAGDLVLHRCVKDLAELHAQGVSVLKGHDPCPPLKIYKNNVDGKGASYGSHENYQYSRSIDFDVVAQALIPFFTTRQVIIGAGRMGIGQNSERPGFQISQRADYIEQEISLETTLNRGIVNTRDEPHAAPAQFRRLHTIVGDANMSQYSAFLKMGMTELVLDAIEDGVDFTDLRLSNAVAEIKAVSHDLSLTHRLQLRDGRRLTAIEILRVYLDRVHPATTVQRRVAKLWDEVLTDLARDPLSTADRLDWTAKYALISRYLDRGVALDDAKLALVDLQYADIDPQRSLYHALVRSGRMRTLVDAEAIARAVDTPPSDSRAYLRGRLCARFPEDVVSASWLHITLATTAGTAVIAQTAVDGGTRELVGDLVESATSVDELVAGLVNAGVDVVLSDNLSTTR
ncbi:depupylase/deamidase Dop [Corynebacterium uterequi]|uniref:Proteasome accessory factor PafA2 n=1 Tax=Corynebacterium uterequi TaxID=1072256 RepID=A0A0G3HEA4_9CORY|nr:depupylase/deamidase Dop [Corynebacterium uterequi]AKK11085.1 proteasome accessory factor PafA2 [Corynebacterium uterequi]